MKTIYLVLMLSPVVFMIPYGIQYLDYHKTIYEFEEKCEELQKQDQGSCIWPGGPPQKPLLEQWFNQI